MKKKLVALLLTGAMAGTMLAGCGDSGKAADSGESTEKTEAADDGAEEAADDTESDSAAGGVTLNVTTTFAGTESNVDKYQETIENWQKETGNKVNDSSASADEAMKARVITDFETGAEPDVMFYFNGNDSNPFVEAGKVVSIDEIREKYPEYASNMNDDLIPAAPADGVKYAVPFYGYWEGMYVNKKVCEEAGVEIPGADTTWEQFMETCQKIKDAGYTPIAASLVKEPHYWFEYSIYNHDTPATHVAVPEKVDDKVGKAWAGGLADIKDVYEKGFFTENTNTCEADEAFQGFLQDKAAFYVDGSWKMGGIKENSDNIDNFTVTFVPGQNERKTTDIISGLSSGWYISRKAWDDPEKQKAAVELVEYFINTETVSEFAGTATTALADGVEIDESTLNSLEKDALTMLKSVSATTGACQDLCTEDQRAPIFTNLPQIVEGQMSIEDSIQQVIDAIEE